MKLEWRTKWAITGATLLALLLLELHPPGFVHGASMFNAFARNSTQPAAVTVKVVMKTPKSSPWYSDIPVDVVVTYFNATDPAWLAEYGKYHNSVYATSGTVPNRGEVYLSLATVHKYAPWVRRIYVVTMAQQLDLGLLAPSLREKMEIVDHTSFIPREFLPTFSTMAIEAFLHRIPGLQEHFIYLNDDMMFSRPFFKSEMFSRIPGVSFFYATWSPHWQKIFVMPPPPQAHHKRWQWVYYNAAQLLSSKFGGGGRHGWHAGFLLRRASYKAAWAVFGSELNRTASHRFRTYLPMDQGGDFSPIPIVQYTGMEFGLQARKNAEYHEIERTVQQLPPGIFHTFLSWDKSQSSSAFALCQAFNGLSPKAAKSICSSIVEIVADAFHPASLGCICADPEVGKACRVA